MRLFAFTKFQYGTAENSFNRISCVCWILKLNGYGYNLKNPDGQCGEPETGSERLRGTDMEKNVLE
jgi:hypothetical protein